MHATAGGSVTIGSQSVLGQFPQAPATLLASMVADVFPRNRPERADLIDGSIGEGSRFHEEFGYYAQGVGETTAILPAGWRERLVRVSNPNTGGIGGLCLEVHDLRRCASWSKAESDATSRRGVDHARLEAG